MSLKRHFDLIKDGANKLSHEHFMPSMLPSEGSPNKKILFISEKVKKAEEPIIKKFKPASKQIFKVQKQNNHKFLRTPSIRDKSDIFICQKVIQDKDLACTLY